MLCKRIIPCLDIKDGRTVKGTNFVNLRDAGNPVVLATHYSQTGADELVFLDITATNEKRKTLLPLVYEVAKNINIPFTVGGGVTTLHDVDALLANGADKIAINTAAITNPNLISDIANKYGSQCVVVAIDIKLINNQYLVHSHGGKTPTTLLATAWASQVAQLGAGEILLTCMDNDGTKAGFAIDITKIISQQIPIPVIASGGGGTMAHFAQVLTNGNASAALAASVFHYNDIKIPELKTYLHQQNIPIRL